MIPLVVENITYLERGNHMQNIDKKKKILIISLLAAILIIPIIFAIINALKSATLIIKVAPETATVTINGEKYVNGEYHLYPGTYEAVISQDGTEKSRTTLNLASGSTERLYKCLSDTHSDDDLLCFEVNEYLAEKAQQEKFDSEEIFNYTPYHSYKDGFNIDPYFNEEDKVVIRVTLISCQEAKKAILKEKALEWLKSKGTDLDKYEIIYQDSCTNN